MKRSGSGDAIEKTIPSVAVALMLALSLFLPINVVKASTPRNHIVTNVTDRAFTVTWITASTEQGYVEWGNALSLSNRAEDDRGSTTNSTTHHVTVSGLTANTTYFYDIISGDARDNNGGNHYQVTTGPTLTAPGSDLAYGQVFKSGGIVPAEGTIVFARAVNNDGSGSPGNSQTYSALVESSGYWNINIGTIRTENLSAWFVYSPSGDNLTIQANGGRDGAGAVTVDTGNDSPAASITLVRPGDATRDGPIDSRDITRTERIIAGLNITFPSADANLDGSINAVDITMIERIIVGFE